MNHRILSFENPVATFPEHSGGKGANLALLTQRGFLVPRGFVVTTAVYRDFIRQSGFAPQPGDPETLRNQLGKLPLRADDASGIGRWLETFPEGTAFSVRSSSTMEDLAGAAFAGQHETFLNVSGTTNVLDRIRACFVSLWEDRAIAYRERQGFDHSKAEMAVVVQQMVASEVSGVGFSVNPVNGRLDEMVLNANFGLGESVVGGEVEIDQWVIDRKSGRVSSASIGRKSTKVVGDGQGTIEIELDDNESSAASLDESRIKQLVDLLVKVEAGYAFPQDIEWAFADGRLWLLQSRPITTIPPRWTRDESAERFPNVITPLTWDFVESGFHRSLNHSFGLLGFPAFHGKWFAKTGHYVYGNQNAVELYARRTPFAVRSLEELRAAVPQLRERFAWVQELPVSWMRDLDHYLVTLGRLQAVSFEGMTPLEIWRHVLAVNEHGARYFLPNIAISIAHGTICRIFHHLLKLVMGDGGDRLFDRLMAWCDTKTGQINKELFGLALAARGERELREMILNSDAGEIIRSGKLEAFPEFERRFGRFLRDHGHREVDFDAYAATWCEAPWTVLENVRLILRSPMDQSPSEKQRELKVDAQQAEMELFGGLPEDLHFFFHELLRLARVYTSLDDLEHYQTTRLTPELRRGLRALGQCLVERGFLDDPMDVFFAHQHQLEEALTLDREELWSGFVKSVAAQKSAYESDRARTPEWIAGEAEVRFEGDESDALEGLAGSAGVVEGPVFIVLDPKDFASFPSGSILVTRTTNPSWTPLFYSAIAVITESGGPLSHGAVTAREMGIPAVMSVRNSLARLTNGQRVRVDGGAGRVEILS